MVAVPPDTAVTVPFSTVATDVLFELHLTFWFVASVGKTVAVKVAVAPLTKGNSVCESVTPETGIVTNTSQVETSFSWLPLAATVAVIVAFPVFSPFIVREVASIIRTVVEALLVNITVSFSSIPFFVSTSVCTAPLVSERVFSSKDK